MVLAPFLQRDESLIAQLPIARKFRLSHHPRGMSGVQSLRGQEVPCDL